MQPATSDKTFHLKWNNHLQNLSQLFTTIYSSSALADVTLSCRDGSIRAHKLVLSACSPYFEQIFKDNPCKHPVIILKGIPYAEINLLVEFMYKGSVDVQELDLQSLMHTASELEIRGLAYELRKDASNLLNVNLNEYPNFSSTPNTNREVACQPVIETAPRPAESPYDATPRSINPYQTNLERLRQIHMYQQAMCRPAEGSTIKRKRKNEDSMPANTTTAVENILAAAAKELAEKKSPIPKQKISTCIQTDETDDLVKDEAEEDEESEAPLHGRDTRFKGKKRVSVGLDDHYPSSVSKVKPVKRSVKFSIKSPNTADLAIPEDAVSKLVISAVTGNANTGNLTSGHGTLKCVNLDNLRNSHIGSALDVDDNDNDNEDSSGHESSDDNTFDESKFVQATYPTENEEYDSSDCGKVESTNKTLEKIFKCDLCDLSYSRNSHMIRHRRTHSGERPFKCNTCPFSFNRSSHLARHRRTHTGERPYRCEACGRCFARGDKLKLHMRICEKDEYVLPSHNTVTEQDVSKILKKDLTMMSGMVSIGHSERHQLMFTSSGEVMLPPRDSSNHINESDVSRTDDFNSTNASSAATPSTSDTSLLSQQYYSLDSSGYPTKRGRGRPRKKPLPPISMPVIKKKRGRPPKVIKLDPSDNSRGLQNYTASDLPYGDFSYLTDIISTHFNQPGQQSYPNMVQLNAAREASKLPTNISSNFAHKVDIRGTTLTGKHTIDAVRKIVLQEKTPESAQSDILTIKKVRVDTNNENMSSGVLPIVIPEITVPSEVAAVDSHCDEPTSDEEKSPENSITEMPTKSVEEVQTSIEEVDSDEKNESPDSDNMMMVGDCQVVNIKGTLETSSELAEGITDVPDMTPISECIAQPVEPNVE